MFQDHVVESVMMSLAVAAAAGVLVQVVAERFRIPAIGPLLLAGIALGPEFAGLVNPSAMGVTLKMIVSFAVAIILFEGGLSLTLSGYRSAPVVIRRLLTVGVLVTWVGTAALAALLFPKLPFSVCVLAGSLIIVTGPTVVTPLLRRIRITEKLHHALLWEGVLIDPIGVFVAVFCFEWISLETGAMTPLVQFALRVLVGMGLGGLCGLGLGWVLKNRWIPDEHINLFVLGTIMLFFGLCESIIHESGILAAVVAGQVLAVALPGQLEGIKKFKSELTHLGIGVLFILLAATLKVQDVIDFGWQGVLMIAAVLFVIRPLNVFLSSWGCGLTTREKLFLSWIAPRGVVAASMAALFAIVMESTGMAEEGAFIKTFTYSVIGATVILQGFSAGLLASWLKVKRPEPKNWLIVGAHPFALQLARVIRAQGHADCLIVDTNPNAVRQAKEEGLPAILGDALDSSLLDSAEVTEAGFLLALTDNASLNQLICQRWSKELDLAGIYCWAGSESSSEKESEHLWHDLPKPSRVGAELEAGDSRLGVRAAEGLDGESPGLHVLGTFSEGRLMPIGVKSRPPSGQLLVLERGRPRLGQVLRPELVIRGDYPTLEDLLRALVERALIGSKVIPVEETIQGMLEREKSFPTALGRGVAVPHAYCDALRQPICVVAQVPAGMEWQAPDRLPVRLVYFLISSSRRPQEHLALLAEISRLAMDEALTARLVNTERPEDLIDLILAGESGKKHFPPSDSVPGAPSVQC